MNFKPTQEQTAIVSAGSSSTRPHLAVFGYAGAAKTSTMLAMGAAKGRAGDNGHAFFFNKVMADEMQARIRTQQIAGLSAGTLHSQAYRAMRPLCGDRVGARLLAKEIAAHLGFHSIHLPILSRPITANGVAYIALHSLAKFCHSGDQAFGKKHLSAGEHEVASYRLEVREACAEASKRLVEAVFDPKSSLPLPHDVYLKRYVEAVAANTMAPPRMSYLIGDEFQDANGVTMKFVETMRSRGVQTIIAGDPYQQIYRWRGSVDAMSKLATDQQLELTQSFRFGQPLADLATAILGELGGTVRLTGNPSIDTRVDLMEPQPYAGQGRQAIICRTNAGVLSAALTVMNSGRDCYIPKAAELVNVVMDIADLRQNRLATRTELRVFDSLEMFLEFVDQGNGGEYVTINKMIDEHGAEPLVSMLQMASKDSNAPTVALTAHSSKGLQYPSVVLADDFPSEPAEKPDQTREQAAAAAQRWDDELRLLYVAATRAQEHLDASSSQVIRDLVGGKKGRRSSGKN